VEVRVLPGTSMKYILNALIVFLLFAFIVTAQTEPDVVIPSATIRGIVLDHTGENPVKGVRVRVWNSDTETIVFETKSDETGLYNIPKYDSGNYHVTIGAVKIDAKVLRSRGSIPQHNGFVLVLPKRMPLLQTLPPVPTGTLIMTAPVVVSP
jgi:hypothetical protein